MGSEEVDFDRIAKGFAGSEKGNRNNRINGPRPLHGPAETPRAMRWMVEGLLGAGLVFGLTSLGVAAHYRKGMAVRSMPRDSNVFSTVAADMRALVPHEEPPSPAAESTIAEHPAPSPRRERPGPAEDPNALLALAEQPKMPPAAKHVPEGARESTKLQENASAPTPEPVHEPAIPESLSRAAVYRALSPLQKKVVACHAQAPSDATIVSVILVVDPDGSVEEVQVEGAVGASPAGACVAAVVKGARFEAWNGHAETISYPFSLK